MEIGKNRYLIDLVTEEVKARLKKQTIKALQTTIIPRHAFVVVEVPKFTAKRGINGGKYEREVSFGLAFLNVDDQPGQEAYLQHLTGKRGCKMITYGNFPTHDSADATVRRKFALYSNPESGNPWDNLRSLCENLIRNAPVGAAERIGYQRELEELKQKLKERETATDELKGNDSGKRARSKRASGSEDGREEAGDSGQF